MDLELLFSTQPFFVTERSGAGEKDKKQNSMFIKPNISTTVELPAPAESLLAAAAASGSAAPVQVRKAFDHYRIAVCYVYFGLVSIALL